ncbi:MAG: glycoside hydrolase 43 family protein [Clostridia bacterium]|nr:glycoside hydrolase 43 family protein [Clostridia bacterium]
MRYENPVICSDYSDPDVIRVGSDFFMVSSSFNFVPGVPVLHSKNLVEWRLINYVIDQIPFEGYDKVLHGSGAWAPSIRCHMGKFYCLIPFPDEGIFVSTADNPYGKWSPLRLLIKVKGAIDPCPIWTENGCYIVCAFAKSRAGFNSKLALFEADEELYSADENYTVIYSGENLAPTIEGPKIYKHGKYFHILAPCGGVKNGWQVDLRSENIYGPYETKVVLMQGDTDINGPHQGALIDLDDEGNRWAFMHFQDKGAYGRVVHLQPASWRNGWAVLGAGEGIIAGTPAADGEYPADIKTDYKLDPNDDFKNNLSPLWQNPANPQEGWYDLKGGLRLFCVPHEGSLGNAPQLFLQKVPYLNFSVKTKCRLNLLNDGDEAGFILFGRQYGYVCVVRRGGQNYLEIRKGSIDGKDETIARSQPYDDEYITFSLSAKYEEHDKLTYRFSAGGSAFTHKFYAEGGVWTGARMGVYARSENGGGYATFKHFKVVCTDNRVGNITG